MRLRLARRAKGLTLRQLADLVGVDFTYLSKLENDRLAPPSDATIERLSSTLGVPPDEFFAVARKVPTELRRHVREAPPETALLLRRLSSSQLTPEQYQRILEILGTPDTDPGGHDETDETQA